MIRLESRRLVVREWQSNEAEALHRWLGDPAVMHFVDFGTGSVEETRAHLDAILAEQRRPDRERFWLAVELRRTSRPIGDVGLTVEVLDGVERMGDVGWFIERAHWGHGYASEAAKLLLDFGFEQLGLDRMRASCDARNTRSERVMQRCGMRFDREVTRPSRPGRRLHYQLDRVQWSALSGLSPSSPDTAPGRPLDPPSRG